MAYWWNSLTDLQRIFAFIGIVQTILLLFGIGDGDDPTDIDGDGIPDGDTGDDGLTLFSVRGIVGMFCIAGWSGIVFIDLGLSSATAIVLALLCGAAALFGIA